MKLTNLNQKIILKTGLFGIFIGVSTTLGWSQQKELYILILMIIATIFYLKNKLKSNIFLHSLIIGLSWGIDSSLIQIIFLETFIINNPNYANGIISIPNINSRLFLLIFGLFWGLISSILIWISVYFIRKLRI
jgi:hypothetical protein|tara:strand:- start:169 stop:570 length:402 start_codon:yes stop_codon:yes gene_type:complete